jgi:hypothetical protein
MYSRSRRNPEPAPLLAPDRDKSHGKCNFCGYSVLWDDAGVALMKEHFAACHPNRI